MALLADFHTHTSYCDGAGTPREMVETAYKNGIYGFRNIRARGLFILYTWIWDAGYEVGTI